MTTSFAHCNLHGDIVAMQANRVARDINGSTVVQALDKMGYRGPVEMEAFASVNPEKALEAFREAFTL